MTATKPPTPEVPDAGAGTARVGRGILAQRLTVQRYRSDDAVEWDRFIQASRNGTFQLERGYLEYHRERFVDCSLLVRDEAHRIVALLPANRDGNAVHSHAGLSYGGFVYGADSGALDASAAFKAVLAYLGAQGIEVLHYKPVPAIHHRHPAQEDLLALFEAGALLSGRQALSVVPRESRLAFRSRRRRGVGQARRAEIEVAESTDLSRFWTLLAEVLDHRHGATPVHSLAEIELLHSRFPAQIRLFLAIRAGETVAGVLVFESERVARAQYICSGEHGRRHGALDAVFQHLLEVVYRDKPWFDFGSSHHTDGSLNEGLILHKEEFGARTIVQDQYLLRVVA